MLYYHARFLTQELPRPFDSEVKIAFWNANEMTGGKDD